ncbi:MAG: oligosaccharide flippase family protein, partial [Halobacteriaceae archaeon]
MGDETPIDRDSVRQLFKGGSIDFSGTLVSYAILFVGKAVLSRYLDVGDFGSVALGMTVITIITTVALIGMEPGLTRFIPRMKTSAERRDIVYSGLLIGLGTTTISAIGLYLLAPILTVRLLEGSNLTAVFRVFAVSIPFFAFMRLMVSITRGYERVVPKVSIKQITLPITRLASITAVSVLGLGAVAAAGAYLVSFLIASVVGLVYLVREVDIRADAPFSPRVRELFIFSAPLALSGAVSMILSDVDAVMLGAFKSSSAVGLYEIAYTLG